MRFRALVADDEPLALAMVAKLLRHDPEIESVVECCDAGGVRAAIAAGGVDIAFLDIEMPGASGLELAVTEGGDAPVVVFVTAFRHYAAQAFDVDATDYVLKPFSDARLQEALERAKKRVRERRLSELADQVATLSAELKEGVQSPSPPASAHPCRLAFRQGERSILINVSDILWIQAEDYYVRVHATTGRYMVRATMSSLEDRLDSKTFLRVHRAAIVNLDEVRELDREMGLVLVLADGSRVTVSRSRRHAVESALAPKRDHARRKR